MPALYEKLGIRFLYPENWQLDESEAVGGWPTVTVYSPQGAFWSVMLDSPTADPKELAVVALRALRQDYAESEAEPASDTVDGEEIAGFDVSFYYVDLVNTAMIRGFQAASVSGVILFQAEDRDFRELEPVFRAMTISLFRSLHGNDMSADEE